LVHHFARHQCVEARVGYRVRDHSGHVRVNNGRGGGAVLICDGNDNVYVRQTAFLELNNGHDGSASAQDAILDVLN
jgi:hypothetical protein